MPWYLALKVTSKWSSQTAEWVGWGGGGKEGVEVIAVFRGKKYVEANWDVPCAEMILCHLKLSHFPQNITDSLLPSFQH